MAAEEGSRIFVGGISQVTTERDLDGAFSRFGDILQSQIIRDKDTGSSRGYGFITFSDRRAMDESIKEMHGKELGDRVITVNRAEPKSRRDECFKCGQVGHWARYCPFSGRGGPAYGGSDEQVDHYADRERYVDREHYVDDQYDYAPRFDARDRFESREGYIPRDRYASDRFWAPADRSAGGDRYIRRSERYPPARDGGGDRYGGGRIGGPIRGGDEGRRVRSRPGGPYDRPSRSSGGGGN